MPALAMTQTDHRKIGHHMARGAVWMVLMRLVIRGTGLINMVIMARLLVPEDFGLIAMASIFIGAIETFSEFSFDVALIKDQKAGRKHYDTAWTLSIIRGLAAALILVAIAGPAAAAFDEPRLQMIVVVLATSPLILGFQNIGVVDFRKTLNFRKDFILMASEKVVAVVVAVGLALVFRNYWALVGGVLISRFWRLVASYVMHPYRPTFSLAAWRELFAFTKWLLLQNILLFFKNRIDRLVIGKMLGASTLGLYTIAFDLANLVTTELMSPIRRALLPGFAKLVDKRDQMRTMFIEVFGLTLWLGAPIAIGIGLLALPLVTLLLGDGWLQAVPIIQILVIAGFVALLSSCSHPIFLALGRPELPTILSGLSVIFLVPGLLIGTSSHGVIGAAIAIVIAQLAVAIGDIMLILGLLQLRLRVLGAIAWRSISALALMAMLVQLLIDRWPYDGSWIADAGLLITATFLGGTAYVSVSLLLWKLFGQGQGPERHLVQQILHRLSGLRRRRQSNFGI